MIRYLIDFALRNRILVLSVAILLFAWGTVSFHNLPIEAYPDVADTYTQVITQWPGHAAEEVEQQITVPLEVQLNGVAHMTHLRSASLSGLSVITIIYDDEITVLNARQEVIDRLQQVTLPPGVNPCAGSGLQPHRPDHVLHAAEHESKIRRHGTEDAERLGACVNQLKSVPNVVDVSPFGGPTREYQVQLDPGKMVSYGLSLPQVEQALTPNNIDCRRRFHRTRRAGAQCSRCWLDADNQTTLAPRWSKCRTARRYACATSVRWCRRPKCVWDNSEKPSAAKMERSSTTTMWSRESFSCARAPRPTRRSTRFIGKSRN